MLGTLAGIIGSAASIAVTCAMSHFGRRPLPWYWQPVDQRRRRHRHAVVVVLVGVLATWDVVARKPLGYPQEQA